MHVSRCCYVCWISTAHHCTRPSLLMRTQTTSETRPGGRDAISRTLAAVVVVTAASFAGICVGTGCAFIYYELIARSMLICHRELLWKWRVVVLQPSWNCIYIFEWCSPIKYVYWRAIKSEFSGTIAYTLRQRVTAHKYSTRVPLYMQCFKWNYWLQRKHARKYNTNFRNGFITRECFVYADIFYRVVC